MTLVDKLLAGSESDRDVLRVNKENGDRPEIPRDIDFVFYCPNKEKSELLCSFVNDNTYGTPSITFIKENKPESQWRVMVTIKSPCTENVICTLSAAMEMISAIFGFNYDGWGSSLCN